MNKKIPSLPKPANEVLFSHLVKTLIDKYRINQKAPSDMEGAS
jgi:hypothetical protein